MNGETAFIVLLKTNRTVRTAERPQLTSGMEAEKKEKSDEEKGDKNRRE